MGASARHAAESEEEPLLFPLRVSSTFSPAAKAIAAQIVWLLCVAGVVPLVPEEENKKEEGSGSSGDDAEEEWHWRLLFLGDVPQGDEKERK